MNRVSSYNTNLFAGLNKSSSKADISEINAEYQQPENMIERFQAEEFVRPLSNMASLSPINQYKYMENFGEAGYSRSNLKEIPGNPEATIRRANLVIDSAALSPMLSNPDKEMLDEAIQLKRRMESRLDKIA